MKKTLIYIIAIIVILSVFGFIVFGTSKQTSNQTSSTENISENTISIKNFSFEPSSLTVKTGTTITWTNQDSTSHDIKSDIFSSPILMTGDKFEFTFNAPGTFNYFCGIHPAMTGTIIVE